MARAAFIGRTYLHLFGAIVAFTLIEVWLFSSGPTEEGDPVELLEGKRHGKGVIARLAGCEDRDAAARWLNTEIAIRRDQLPATAAGEYYWNDLIGLKVITTDGVELGVVKDLMETGANDVLVIRGDGHFVEAVQILSRTHTDVVPLRRTE